MRAGSFQELLDSPWPALDARMQSSGCRSCQKQSADM